MSNYRSPNQVKMESLWREYVMSDPDLRAIELEKRKAARRRTKKAHFHQARVEAFYAIKQSFLIFALGALTTVAILAMTIIFFCLA